MSDQVESLTTVRGGHLTDNLAMKNHRCDAELLKEKSLWRLKMYNEFSFQNRLDFSRVAIIGHSFGGAAVLATLATDTRFKYVGFVLRCMCSFVCLNY